MSARPLLRGLAPVLALTAAACTDEPPPPSGNLDRPSGLAIVDRGEGRSDVLIADSEAGGLRVLQLRRTTEIDGSFFDEESFVFAPSVFFPLAIPASGFPTDVAVSKSPTGAVPAEGDQDRAYVLAPATAQLHVLDVRAAGYRISATAANTYYSRGSIDLEGVVAEPAIPVDVETLPSRAGLDVVVVALDVLGADHGLVAVLHLRNDADPPSVVQVETRRVPAAPRELGLRAEAPAGLWLSSATSTVVAFVPVTTASAAEVLGAPVEVEVGGPTLRVVDAGPTGALALRLDRASAVWIDTSSGQPRRGTMPLTTPFTPAEELGTPDARGRLDLRPSPAVAGAHARLASLPSVPLPDPGGDGNQPPVDQIRAEDKNGSDGLADVVALVHADALLSFVVGSPPRLALSRGAGLTGLRAVRSASVSVDGCARITAGGASCEAFERNAATDPGCAADAFSVPPTADGRIEAVYRAPLVDAAGGSWSVRVVGGRAMVELSQAGRAGRGTFAARQVRIGDRADFTVRARDITACAAPDGDLVVTATVTWVGETVLELEAEVAALAPLDRCETTLPLSWLVVRPAGAELVVRSVGVGATQPILEVYERVPVVDRGDQVATLTAPIRATLRASGRFACEPVESGAFCSTDADCGGGGCVASSQEACLGRCADPCSDPESTSCPALRPPGLRCDGVVFEVEGAIVSAVVPAGVPNQAVTSAAPDDVAFEPTRGSFFVSYPGARAVGEAVLSPTAGPVMGLIR